ncbi:hypothetical protein [Bradyrhizobium sp. DASA03007]|uniref:hypothetical protein n=1 Tax=unclassified Bradyrhizobium TaxID=2631580 RepID=UPI003F7297DF
MTDISLRYQKMEVSDTRLITVSDLVQDTDGSWVRSVRFYGDPIVNGAPTGFVEILTRSDNKDDLEIQAPGFKY